VLEEDIAHLSPARYEHSNPYGAPRSAQPLAVSGHQVKLEVRIEQLRVLRAQGNVA